ncbi:hypothetical protein [Streptomyces incanus]|uniref:Urease accessory protein UreG n=1 Tax=Streptomyces incanus TaxID=887453 RepID=A0ABW0XWC6_9ACTN
MPRKCGPGITDSGLLVISKVDIAPYARADLAVMRRDAARFRGNRPFVLTDCLSGHGVRAVADHLTGMFRGRPA